jgi:hydroxyacylglutathione hydrolase
MFFRQYNLACLSLYSYLIGDTTTGRAVVVDPQRDISEYLADAHANGLRIERVIETHFHADFLARDLYRSLRTKLLTLPDATRVFPAHGAGSACGKNLSTAASSTPAHRSP